MIAVALGLPSEVIRRLITGPASNCLPSDPCTCARGVCSGKVSSSAKDLYDALGSVSGSF